MESPLNQAIACYKRGEKQQAAALFAEFVALEPLNETAWLWMAACAETPGQKRAYLQRVLEINPAHEKAQQALAMLLPAEEPGLAELVGAGQMAYSELRSDLELISMIELARLAEQNQDYQQMYNYFCGALELDAACQEAWIGKGLAAGMLATFHKTNTSEVKQCLWEQVIIRGRSAITRENFLDGLDQRALKRVIDGFAMAGSRLVEILESIDFTSEKAILRVLELDRESLSLYDCAFFLTRFQEENYHKRPDWREMVGLTRRVVQRIEYGMSVLSLPQEQAQTYTEQALKAFALCRLGVNERFMRDLRAK